MINIKYKYENLTICIASHLITTVTCSLFFNISKTFAVEMCINLALSFRMEQDQMKILPIAYAYITSFLMTIAMLVILHHFQNSRGRNVHNFYLRHPNESISIVNVAEESPYMTSYLIAKLVFAFFHHILDILSKCL